MENVKRINKYLTSTYGMSLDNKPKFRVAHSDSMFEVRTGLFERYYGPIYLGEFEGTQKAPKYSYIKNRWVLEVYTLAFPEIFGPSIRDKERTVVVSDHYEPLRVFRTKDHKYLPPDMEICKIVCDAFIELINRPQGRRITDKIALNNEQEQVALETKRFFELLNADDSDLIHKFRDREAVIIHRGDS